MNTLQHHPNVEVMWEAWPFSVILWDPVREFIQGHGLNPFFNVWLDVTRPIILFWNTFMGILFWWFNLIWFILNFIPNVTIGTLSDIIFFIPEVVTFFTRIGAYALFVFGLAFIVVA